jgi:deoxycytidylate deaminase
MASVPTGKNKHFSFLFRRGNLISLGWSDSCKTHPLASKYGYRHETIHSELACILRVRSDLKGCRLVNTRINIRGEIGISKPCKNCQRLLRDFGIVDVWYTNYFGEFERMKNES